VLPETPPLLSVTVTDPEAAPAARGENVTLTTQEDPAASVAPHVPDCPKCVLATIDEMLKTADPELLTVTVCAVLVVPRVTEPKESELGATPATGAIPVPVSATICVLPGTPPLLSVTVKDPEAAPAATGENVTLITQEDPAASVAPHVPDWPKCALATIDAMFRTADPELLRVTVCVALVVPTS